jgi:formate dehydrogenase subunit gamma
MTEPDADMTALVPDDEVFVRMGRAERWQHGLLIISFSVLMLTGLPLLFGWGGGHPIRGILHRAAALVLIADLLWSLLDALLTERGRRSLRDRMPKKQDVKDAVGHFRLRSRRPEYARYSFVEKLDHWSLVIGSAVMIATGFFMSFPRFSLKLFPLWLHQVFVVVHGYEAVLALAAVIIGHLYAVHLNPGVFPMSRVWLDGKMTGAELRRSHPLEYRRVLEARKGSLGTTGPPEESIIDRE